MFFQKYIQNHNHFICCLYLFSLFATVFGITSNRNVRVSIGIDQLASSEGLETHQKHRSYNISLLNHQFPLKNKFCDLFISRNWFFEIIATAKIYKVRQFQNPKDKKVHLIDIYAQIL